MGYGVATWQAFCRCGMVMAAKTAQDLGQFTQAETQRVLIQLR